MRISTLITGALLGLLGLSEAWAQVPINVTTDSIIVLGPHTETRAYRFSGRRAQTRYHPSHRSFGLQFRNGLVNDVSNSILVNDINASPIIGVGGPGTRVNFKGYWDADGNNTIPVVAVYNGGYFFIDSAARIDLMQDSYFTRQIWTYGDGTGTVELDSNWVADRTQFATVPEGCGSLRYSNVYLITHHTRSLPFGYRPNSPTGYDINAHFVFEDQDGSTWSVRTNNQEYRGGLWVNKSMTVDCQTNLLLNGVNTTTTYSIGGAYTNYGGIAVYDSLKTLTKTGPGVLEITGFQTYQPKTTLNIAEGRVLMASQSFVAAPTPIYPNTIRGVHLSVDVQNGAELQIRTPLYSLRSLRMKNPGASLEIGHTAKLEVRDTAYLQGALSVFFPVGTQLNAGDSFDILDITQREGRFDQVILPDYGVLTWDTTQLYVDGTVRIASGSVVVGLVAGLSHKTLKVWPNPARNELRLALPQDLEGPTAQVVNIQGQSLPLPLRSLGQGQFQASLEDLAPGLYWVEVKAPQGIWRQRLVRE